MQQTARAVVIGGGCVGAGILYGLAKRGWTDVCLLERTQLTAGSTWHAAGLLPTYARDRNIGRMIQKSIEIYEGLEAETGMHVGWHKCGQLRVAKSRDRWDEYRSYMDTFETQDIRAQLLNDKQVKELWPLLRDDEMPFMGKAWGAPNLWLAEGVPGGILWGAAIGYLSEQIVEGGNEIDTSALEPRRFGDYANKAWTLPKVREALIPRPCGCRQRTSYPQDRT